MHHIRSHRHDVHYDQQVVAKMQFTQGYQNMLTKYRDGMSFVSKLPGAFGMNAIGDVAKRGLHKALFEVHDSLDVRIDSVRNYANP